MGDNDYFRGVNHLESREMRNNLFGRYVWLIEFVRNNRGATFREIADGWVRSSLNEEGEPLSLRTFHRHREAIRKTFGIEIACDTRNDTYSVEGLDGDSRDNTRNWLLDSYATLNQLIADQSLKGRICFEEIPSGRRWLSAITDAMRRNCVLIVAYRRFGAEEKRMELEPYALKVSRRRWYVVGRNVEMGALRCYALDRVMGIEEKGDTFVMDEGFDMERYFEGCCGIYTGDGPLVRVVVAAIGGFANYLRELPIHGSQVEVERDEDDVRKDRTRFELTIHPTLDFYQQMLSFGNQAVVLEPKSVAEKMGEMARGIWELYGE